MGMLRAVTIAVLATWGLGAPAAPASADEPLSNRTGPYLYTPYDATAAPGFFDFNWSGFYVGAHLGAGHTLFEASENIVFSVEQQISDSLTSSDSLTFGQSATSVVGGVQAGWQKQWEKIVAGIEVTYTSLPFDETTQSPLLPGVTRSGELHDLFTLTGRLGYADGRWLAYAKGGWASAEIDVTYTDSTGAVTASSGGRESGWTAGVGIDYALTQNLFLGIEYNYLHFRADVSPPTSPNIQISDVDVDIQTLVVRLNYRFGGPCDRFGRC